MRDYPEGGEFNPAEGVRRRCKKNSSVLSRIGKRTREDSDRGSEVAFVRWTVHRGLDGEGPVSPRKPKETDGRGSCEQDFASKKSSECA